MFTTEEKDIRQLFEELKSRDETLVPDFEAIYQAAARKRMDRRWYLRRAAAIAIVVTVSFLLLLFIPQRTPRDFSEMSISDWSSPVEAAGLSPNWTEQSISTWQSPTHFTYSNANALNRHLSTWKSPTDFLLITTKQQ